MSQDETIGTSHHEVPAPPDKANCHACGCVVQKDCRHLNNRDRWFLNGVYALAMVKVPKSSLAAIGLATFLWMHHPCSLFGCLAWFACWVVGFFGIFAAHCVVYIKKAKRMTFWPSALLAGMVVVSVTGVAYGAIWAAKKGIEEVDRRLLAATRSAPVDGMRVEPSVVNVALTYAPKESTITTMDNSSAVKPRPPIRHTVDPPKSAKCPVPAKVADPQMIQCVPCTPCTQ